MKIKLKKEEPIKKKKLSGRAKVILSFAALIIVFAAFFIFYVYEAGKSTAISNKKMKQLLKDYPEINMEITNVTSDSMTLIVSKDIDVDLVTSGSIFQLYQKELGGWNPVELVNSSTRNINSEGSYMVTISGSESSEVILNIKERYGSLPKGEYVLRKTFSIVSEENLGKGMLVYKKFEVK